jgi:hypothetical protein
MNQSKMRDSSDYTCLNPILKAALSSLDLDLESELSRYRRLKNKNSVYAPYNPQVVPVESLNLQEISGLVHQPEKDLSNLKDQEISPPDDYLESSARLLQSLGQNDVLTEQPRGFLNPVKSGWGLSSLLMLFLAGGLLSLAFIPQEIWANVPVIKGLIVSESQVEDELNKAEISKMVDDDEGGNDFSSVNFNNLSILKVKENKEQIPVANTAGEMVSSPIRSRVATKPTPTPNEDLTKALLAPILSQIESKLQEQGDSFSATASISATQLNKSYYYVFSDYKGDRTLAAARQIIKDAYLVQFPAGKKIQFGAFVNQEDANNLVNQLQSRGISATIYDPKN